MITWLVIAFVATLTAALPYVFVETRWRWRWREIEVGRVAADGSGGVYRGGGEVPRFGARAPALVRATALSCFVFGQMFVPGLVLGIFGLMVAGVGLVSIPGLAVAAKIYRTGFALLRREPRVAFFRARDAATWALWLNGILMSGALIAVALGVRHNGLVIVGLVEGYGALSVAQAFLLLHVTRKYEDAFFAGTSHP